jgi:hypothetical protein
MREGHGVGALHEGGTGGAVSLGAGPVSLTAGHFMATPTAVGEYLEQCA